jgi:molybdenum cofactor biosynthesis enzyme MoaA
MWEVVEIVAAVVVIVWILELMDLPDWIGKRFRGRLSRNEMSQKIEKLESRIADLENKSSETQS